MELGKMDSTKTAACHLCERFRVAALATSQRNSGARHPCSWNKPMFLAEEQCAACKLHSRRYHWPKLQEIKLTKNREHSWKRTERSIATVVVQPVERRDKRSCPASIRARTTFLTWVDVCNTGVGLHTFKSRQTRLLRSAFAGESCPVFSGNSCC